MSVRSDGWAFSQGAKASSSGSVSLAGPNRTFAQRLSAASAPSSVSLTTPTKLPSRTMAIRPATARAPSSQGARVWPPLISGRSTRPCNMRGSAIS